MQRSRSYSAMGLVLVALGCLFLLQNFGYLHQVGGNILWALFFGLGGLAFVGVFVSNREHWWALIPGFVLLGLASTLGLSNSDFMAGWVGAIFLGSIGAAFLVIYLLRRDFWWALIPAGALFTLALVAVASSYLPGEAAGAILFLGLAATFALLYFLPAASDEFGTDVELTPSSDRGWALIPAAVLAIIGLLLLAASGSMIGLIAPIGIMVAGAYIVTRALKTRE